MRWPFGRIFDIFLPDRQRVTLTRTLDQLLQVGCRILSQPSFEAVVGYRAAPYFFICSSKRAASVR
jgi:hypothetical protein